MVSRKGRSRIYWIDLLKRLDMSKAVRPNNGHPTPTLLTNGDGMGELLGGRGTQDLRADLTHSLTHCLPQT